MVPAQSVPDGVLDILARYAAIVDDPQAFIDIARQPLAVGFWCNPFKSNPAALEQSLTDLGIAFEPIGWLPGAYQASQWPSPGNTLAFTAGWYYVQAAIAMAAVVALDPQPGECILDMCAAPGGKTAQIATRLGDAGIVMANEMHAARLPSLSATVSRLGLTQVVTLQADGRSLTFPSQTFDRVLVDAPCSGEGNLRRHPSPWREGHGRRIASAQKKLLSRALDLVKPGGTVVYGTCTFAPEENEAVLNAVMGDRAVVEAFDIPGLRGQPGLTDWQGQSYRADIAQARRYWPHQNDTGGFFVAKLRRTKTVSASEPSPAMPTLAAVSLAAGNPIQAMTDRFGIEPKHLTSYQCWATGKRRLWLFDGVRGNFLNHHPETLGIPLATHTNLGLKPSTAFLQRFGPLIQQNVVQLPDPPAAQLFVAGRSQPLAAEVEPGFVHVRYQNFELGCGRYTRGGMLESQIPKMLRWRSP